MSPEVPVDVKGLQVNIAPRAFRGKAGQQHVCAHLASFLRAVSRKSFISLICFGCERMQGSLKREGEGLEEGEGEVGALLPQPGPTPRPTR